MISYAKPAQICSPLWYIHGLNQTVGRQARVSSSPGGGSVDSDESAAGPGCAGWLAFLNTSWLPQRGGSNTASPRPACHVTAAAAVTPSRATWPPAGCPDAYRG